MSFRLSTMPYSLKRRLHELAKPYEVLQMQDASSSCNADFCIRPFRRRFQRVPKITFEFVNGALKTEMLFANVNSSDYVVCERELTLTKLKDEHFKSDNVCWNKFIFRPQIVTINYCELTPEFMATLASLVEGTVKEVYFRNCTGTVNFEALFKAFPNVEHLKIVGSFAKTWASDIVKYQKCSLKSLELEGDFKDGEKFFDFDDFEKLVSAQQPRVMIKLNPLDDPTDAIQEMLLQGDCPDLEFDDPEAKVIVVRCSYSLKNEFLYL